MNMDTVTELINLARQDAAAELHVDRAQVARLAALLEQSAGDELAAAYERIADLECQLEQAHACLAADDRLLAEWQPTEPERAEWARIRK
jgi:hypothetical protein